MKNTNVSIDQIIRYENGEMEDDEMVEMFQAMIDTGMVWTLQGHYGRAAMRLIESGYCTRPNKS